MTLHDDVAAIKKRIAKAESERDAWRAAGPEEKYLEAYFAVEALQLQLDARVRAGESTVAPSPEPRPRPR